MDLQSTVNEMYGRPISECSNEELFVALLHYTKALMKDRGLNEGKRKIYYISAEFLIGKLLSNNLINLGVYDKVEDELKACGKSIAEIEESEPEPSLGNGGLGRLAACFLDSIATLGYSGAGITLNYHLGLFKQVFKNKFQTEEPDKWMTDESWENSTDISFPVQFKDFSVESHMKTIDIIGYNQKAITLDLFDIDTVDESIVHDGIQFDMHDVMKNLTLFIYPDDSTEQGRLLRIYQQYFMVSNAAQLILKEAEEKGMKDLHDLPDYAVVQINDTHPSLVIPELIRLLEERGLSFDDAVEVTENMCAYTNHTILAEALEKWPISYLEKVVPDVVLQTIFKLNELVKAKFEDPSVYIIQNDQVYMANMDIHFSKSVNGVAALHTDILKNTELNNFYQIYPEKFNNKTNGITFRRWLLSCNRPLTALIESLIGPGFKTDADELNKLLDYADDEKVLDQLIEIKKQKKLELTSYVKDRYGLELNPDSIFDIQIKRLHEYKRQQLNVLYIIKKYLEIKKGIYPSHPITEIFGAKAAPAYYMAKDIIHVILVLQELIDSDPEVSKYLKVLMVENYNVTAAEKLIPAADLSEQISLASKEASGTSNMKFMLNGAVTIGTMDGANVEIEELVGEDNIFIFGKSSEEVIDLYKTGDYRSIDYALNDPELDEILRFMLSANMISRGSYDNIMNVHRNLLTHDWFMTLLDYHSYVEEKDKAIEAYSDQRAWAKKMLVNIAKSGYFSSDRTIKQYNNDIWHLESDLEKETEKIEKETEAVENQGK